MVVMFFFFGAFRVLDWIYFRHFFVANLHLSVAFTLQGTAASPPASIIPFMVSPFSALTFGPRIPSP